MELTFCDLKSKDVINICDGRNMGTISDISFDTCLGKITGIIVPCSKNIFNIFKSNSDIFIPYNRICKIGKDIILVDIIMQDNMCNNNCQTLNTQSIPPNKIDIQSLLNKSSENEK